MMILWVAAGGAIGAAARYLVNIWLPRLAGSAFPWHTLTVNVLGCFAMGLIIDFMALKFSDSLEMRAFLTTGILGGFTTFSAFSLDFAALMQRGETASAAAYVLASVALSLAAVFAGMATARAIIA